MDLKYISFCFASMNASKGEQTTENAFSSRGDGLSYFSVEVPPSTTSGYQEYWDRTVKNADVFAEDPRFTLLQLSAHVLCHASVSLRDGQAIKASFTLCNLVLVAIPTEEQFQEWEGQLSN